jgi:hypothetical protein
MFVYFTSYENVKYKAKLVVVLVENARSALFPLLVICAFGEVKSFGDTTPFISSDVVNVLDTGSVIVAKVAVAAVGSISTTPPTKTIFPTRV